MNSDLSSGINDIARYSSVDYNIKENVENVFENKQFDVVYNLAGFANLDIAIKYPLKTIQLNVIGNMHILEQCVKNNVSRFVYASSAYAMSNKGSFYGISKLASEKIVEEYLNKYLHGLHRLHRLQASLALKPMP